MDKIKLIEEEIEKMANVLQAENSDLAMVKKRKEDFANFVTHTLQNSMLTGIPQIAQARNCSKRLMRTLVFVFCIAGFTYQSFTFMNIYWEYDVVMDVQVTNPFYIDPPAITICHSRGVRQDEMCRDNASLALRKNYTVYCESVAEVMELANSLSCDCVPRLCDDKGRPHDWLWASPPRRVAYIEFEKIKPWLIPPEDIAKYSRLENWQTRGGELPQYLTPPEYVKQIPCASYGAREACATVFSKYGEPNGTAWPEISINTKILMEAPFYQKYVQEGSMNNEVYLTIHDPRTIVNPFIDGFPLNPRIKYTFRVNKVEKKLLPAPYKTDCVDYRGLWESRGGKGPLNIKECLLECQVNASLELYSCVLPNIFFVGSTPRCMSGGQNTIKLLEVMAIANKVSAKVCRPACEEMYYDVSVKTSDFNSNYCGMNESNFAAVKILLDGMEVTRYSYSPKYQDIETFSYVGGYVGMWLGISLVAVFDFLETVFLMMKYPLRRFKTFRNKRRIQNQIMHGNLHH